jgi:hypothetical protein
MSSDEEKELIREITSLMNSSENDIIINGIIEAIKTSFDRLETYPDPTIRCSIYFNMIMTAFDMLSGLAGSYFKSRDEETNELYEEFKRRFNKDIPAIIKIKKNRITEVRKNNDILFQKIRNETDIFKEHILTPIYNPDHPFGSNYCKKGQKVYQKYLESDNKKQDNNLETKSNNEQDISDQLAELLNQHFTFNDKSTNTEITHLELDKQYDKLRNDFVKLDNVSRMIADYRNQVIKEMAKIYDNFKINENK